MNTATKNLENDHDHILKLIDVMEVVAGDTSPDSDDIELIIGLIKNYADGLHHAKEENLLFPLLSERGFSQQQGPVAVMLHEHTLGRDFVKGMSEGLRLYRKGEAGARAKIAENMNGYINLLRNHIGKENNILFRMADNVLNESDNYILLNKFSEVEVEAGTLETYIALIDKLGVKYLKS